MCRGGVWRSSKYPSPTLTIWAIKRPSSGFKESRQSGSFLQCTIGPHLPTRPIYISKRFPIPTLPVLGSQIIANLDRVPRIRTARTLHPGH
ncbi:hypothetical protein BD779DRAFT_1563135 [Infundibulicybe gibba]|nr:hypothetical protein BD779DRAFT_1563135 [Infundibulicybe gibba]